MFSATTKRWICKMGFIFSWQELSWNGNLTINGLSFHGAQVFQGANNAPSPSLEAMSVNFNITNTNNTVTFSITSTPINITVGGGWGFVWSLLISKATPQCGYLPDLSIPIPSIDERTPSPERSPEPTKEELKSKPVNQWRILFVVEHTLLILRKMCQERGISHTGRKIDLINRLTSS